MDTDARVKPNALGAWRSVMATCNAPAGADDFVTRWLVLTRACVQPMTLTSAAIAGLLAVRAPGFSVWLFALAALGIVLAHAANNLVNDIFDESLGADTADYPRALYAPHPVISGMATRRTPALSGEDQQSGSEATGGARGRLVLGSGDRRKAGFAGSALSIQTRQGSASTSDCAKVAKVLAMKATTVSKSSSSQKPPIQVGSGGSA